MPGLEPGIHVLAAARKTWMAGSSPAKTKKRIIFTLLGKASGSQDEAGSGRPLFSPHLARDIDGELQLGPLLFLGEDVALFGRGEAALRRYRELIQRRVLGGFPEPPLDVVLPFQLAALGGDDADHHDLVALR